MATVQKDYNQGRNNNYLIYKNNYLIYKIQYYLGHETSVNLQALLNLAVGDTVDVFCSNTDIEIRADYNAAKFTGFLIKRT